MEWTKGMPQEISRVNLRLGNGAVFVLAKPLVSCKESEGGMKLSSVSHGWGSWRLTIGRKGGESESPFSVTLTALNRSQAIGRNNFPWTHKYIYSLQLELNGRLV